MHSKITQHEKDFIINYVALPFDNRDCGGTTTTATAAGFPLPVIVRKKGKTDKHTCAPGQPINGTILYEGNSLFISFPLDGDFFEVTVTSSENAAQTWTATCYDATQIEMSFDGEAGEYYIEIVTPDSSYTGWFEL